MKIVLVEDEAGARNGICNMLRLHTRHELCAVATNGERGCEEIRAHQPDLVITDIRMPKMSGLEMMRTLKQEGCKAEFLILSGYSEFQYAQEALRLGAADYLLKPATPEILTESIARVEERRYAEVKYTPTVEYLMQQLLEAPTPDAGSTVLQQMAWILRVSPQQPCALLLLHLNNCRKKDEAYRRFHQAVCTAAEELCLEAMRLAPLTPRLGVLGVVGDCDKMPRLKNMLERYLLPELQQEYDCTAAFLRIPTLVHLKEGIQQLEELLLSGEEAPQKLLCELRCQGDGAGRYPAGLENEVKLSVFRHESERFVQLTEQFLAVVRAEIHSGAEQKDALLRFFSMVTMQIQEFYGESAQGAIHNGNLYRILEAVTTKELTDACQSIEQVIAEFLHARETKTSLGRLVGETIRYIEQNFQQILDQKEIAAHLGVTPEYLSAQFTRETGVSFSAYIRQYRIRQAKYYLVNTNRKIQEVGAAVGYGEPAYFNRTFRAECGMTPTEYRKNFKAGKL